MDIVKRIDFEPNLPVERCVRCRVADCVFEGNRGPGVQVYLGPLTSASLPVSILVEGCLVRDNVGAGLWVGGIPDGGARGRIDFVRCTVLRDTVQGAYLVDKSAGGALVRFAGCSFQDVAAGFPRLAPIAFEGDPGRMGRSGGIEFAGSDPSSTWKRPASTATSWVAVHRRCTASGDETSS